MIDEIKLKDKYGLSFKEYEAICSRIDELAESEEKSGIVINRCNGTLKSTRRRLKGMLSTKEEVKHCINFFEDHGSFCNCEILLNVLPFAEEMKKDVIIDND